jgi:hypothetical protein
LSEKQKWVTYESFEYKYYSCWWSMRRSLYNVEWLHTMDRDGRKRFLWHSEGYIMCFILLLYDDDFLSFIQNNKIKRSGYFSLGINLHLSIIILFVPKWYVIWQRLIFCFFLSIYFIGELANWLNNCFKKNSTRISLIGLGS